MGSRPAQHDAPSTPEHLEDRLRLTVPSRVVAAYARATRMNRAFASTAGARRRLADRARRPQPHTPPRRLRGDVRVRREQAGGWPVYVAEPVNRGVVGATVYAHGGAWVDEIAPQQWHLVAAVAAGTATAVVVPIYPLVPRGTARAVNKGFVEIVQQSMEEHGSVRLLGDSAGGQIALSAALSLRDAGIVLPMTTLLSPALDLSWSNPGIDIVQPTDPWLGRPGGAIFSGLWRGEDAVDDPVVSPLRGELSGLGPITLLTGTRDVLNPDAHVLRDRARQAGVPLSFHEARGELHVYALLPTAAGHEGERAIVRSLTP